MIRIQKSGYIISAGLIVILVWFIFGMKPLNSEYNMKTIQESDGWSYIILKDETPVIYQKYMPGIEGNIVFDSKRSAKRIGKLVLKKLKNHRSPYISQFELNEVLK